ncbi:MAG: nickel ABC transporter permease subunit NikC [Desulfobacterota bacterium]|jgi:nickel transport system permease protein|nr:nickel ABC transporter permease subunit NikC [Thermodesulfobacteriota bacterium]
MKIYKLLLKRKLVLFALVVLGLLFSVAILAPWIAPHDPAEVDLENKLLDPSLRHPLGTDHLGRDVLSRLMFGARVSIAAILAISLLILTLSFGVGAAAGYWGGSIDSFLMRVCDVFLTFPTFILAMFMVGVLGTGLTNVILAIVLTHWAWYARIIRGLVLSLKNREFVLAARVAGTPRLRILLRHLLPPVVAQLVILATLDMGHMILHIAGLSFLGLGVQPPTPEWGVMINDARQFIWTKPQLILYPGIMIFLTVMAFNIPSDALRDMLDPSIRSEGN